jgi:hypothetical protein
MASFCLGGRIRDSYASGFHSISFSRETANSATRVNEVSQIIRNKWSSQILLTLLFIIEAKSQSCWAAEKEVLLLRSACEENILRRLEKSGKRIDRYWEFVGEAYVHGVMDRNVMRGAKGEGVRVFKIR